jgi:hypothetical protein
MVHFKKGAFTESIAMTTDLKDIFKALSTSTLLDPSEKQIFKKFVSFILSGFETVSEDSRLTYEKLMMGSEEPYDKLISMLDTDLTKNVTDLRVEAMKKISINPRSESSEHDLIMRNEYVACWVEEEKEETKVEKDEVETKCNADATEEGATDKKDIDATSNDEIKDVKKDTARKDETMPKKTAA